MWLLFGAATGTSLWANALHAVRLNQQSTTAGLRLGDTVVAVLSTIAPLALAGAVHLYILLARGPVSPADRTGRTDRNTEGDLGQTGATAALTEPVTELTGNADNALAALGQPDNGLSVSEATAPPVTDRTVRPELTVAEPVTVTEAADPAVSPAAAPPVTDRTDRVSADRSDDRDTEALLEIANKAVQEANNRLTRQIVAQAIRGSNRTLSSDTLTQLMAQLREQQRQNHLTAANRD